MPPVNTERLRERCAELDLSYVELAKATDTSDGYVANIMCGSDSPSLRYIYRLSRALDLPVEQIAIESDNETPTGDPDEQPKGKPPRSEPKFEPIGPKPREDKRGGSGPRRISDSAVA